MVVGSREEVVASETNNLGMMLDTKYEAERIAHVCTHVGGHRRAKWGTILYIDSYSKQYTEKDVGGRGRG